MTSPITAALISQIIERLAPTCSAEDERQVIADIFKLFESEAPRPEQEVIKSGQTVTTYIQD